MKLKIKKPNRVLHPYRAVTQQAIAKCGGHVAVGKHFNITTQAVWGWDFFGRVPYNRVEKLAQLSGVSCRKLRPDIYGKK